ncbi:UDP-N-acetylglucosamine--N-acetylmuramyl-(pentapeptide) pyrophosphoryl-undecaprenol N-acetylglucosamine transferase [Egibacter rhizosphaerae]|uniref:UDP-N-acetylglucosamine--N-acetylmuramyl-(pentapeptide) pyrophosphoryl-undecaprenol N-acetylglucosamine transferase n=1 Tax=Egibacter rhizosphaerae TaxID=1670831 RepID=A0A411YJ65_9ACTN|nr:UDP-N-acetylglucosamine--N-acetylmuramyl-(pentapeptide) pyrophosphoryl-undecaprenol N-acetylglucosamine transferase [Egibacter rhizosphaerae]QBI21270.1 UDP-N-acetylglucosamine--N-acetylmuramyl-(pentapeptide) pyrophosphoryl-undecaprenol N-acetylglucosamine transferase [Egibacter rhizosphaerae]
MKLLVSGGGTAGHVYPALAMLSAWEEADEASAGPLPDVVWVGTPGGMERDIIAGRGLPYRAVPAGALRGKSPLVTAAGIAKLLVGVVVALAVVVRQRPDAVLTTGGYASVPVAIAGRLLFRPVVVFLPDVVPGVAVRLQSRFATRIAASFEDATRFLPARKATVTGYPVRPALLGTSREEARARLGLHGDLPVLLLYGGSLGARTLNYGVTGVLPDILERCQFIHVAGQLDHEELAKRSAELPEELGQRYHLHAFLGDQLVDALVAADLCVSRAGASTLAELPAVGLPAIVVPGPFSDQEANADFLVEHGAAVKVGNDAAQAGMLGGVILDLLGDEETRTQMAACSAALARPDAAHRLIALLRDVAR